MLPTLAPGPHYQGDVREVLGLGWDLVIAHPDCTYLTNSAAWAYGDGPYHQKVKPGTLTGGARREARGARECFGICARTDVGAHRKNMHRKPCWGYQHAHKTGNAIYTSL